MSTLAVEQRDKYLKANLDRQLPFSTIHPRSLYEWAIEKPGLTTPTQMSDSTNTVFPNVMVFCVIEITSPLPTFDLLHVPCS